MSSLLGRVRGDDVAALRAELAELRAETAAHRTELASAFTDLRMSVDHLQHVAGQLNHDVRSITEGSISELRALAELLRDADGLAGVVQLRATLIELRTSVDHLHHVLSELNHDVRSGSDEVLPLFLGHAERLRTDAETVVSASLLMDRQLRRLDAQVDRLTAASLDDG